MFEVFDRDEQEDARPVPVGPVVRVDGLGRLLFNGPAWQLVSLHIAPGGLCQVALWFDGEARILAVQPVGDDARGLPSGALWLARAMRSVEWPRGVDARPFVDRYQVALGEYEARLLRGPGERMVTCEVGAPRPLPAGIPPGSLVEESPRADQVVAGG